MTRRLQTAAAVTCMKTLLMLFNFVFLLMGIIILSLGIWMQLELYQYISIVVDYNNAVAYVLMVLGSVMIITGILAFCCTAKGIPILLYFFSALLVIFFVAEISAGISAYVYKKSFKDGFRNGLNDTMIKYTEDKKYKKMMDTIQTNVKCCGLQNYTDWFNTPFGKVDKSVPESCCHDEKNCKHTKLDENPKDIYTTGCYSMIVDTMESNFGIIVGAALGFAFLNLLGVLLTCCLAKHINKARYEQVA